MSRPDTVIRVSLTMAGMPGAVNVCRARKARSLPRCVFFSDCVVSLAVPWLKGAVTVRHRAMNAYSCR